MRLRWLAVAGVATGMAFLGGALIMLRMVGPYAFQGGTRSTLRVLTVVAFFSNVIWLPIGTYFATRRPSVWIALLIGAASSLFGCFLMMPAYPGMAFRVFRAFLPILIPTGVVTGYLVWRVSTPARRGDITPA